MAPLSLPPFAQAQCILLMNKHIFVREIHHSSGHLSNDALLFLTGTGSHRTVDIERHLKRSCSANSLVRAGSAIGGSSGPCFVGFFLSQRMEPPFLWTTCSDV